MEAMGGSSDTAMGTPMGTPTGPFGVVIESSVTTVEVALTDLSAGGYAINVHESAENIGNYIACGYTSMAQCALSASGRAAQCVVNPYFAGANSGRSRRHNRSQ